MIAKPANEDGSVGIHDDSVVHDEKHLKERIKFILEEYNQPALVEEFIDGREVSVAIIGDLNKKILPPAEIIFKNYSKEKPKIISYNAKWDTDSFEFNNTERRFLEDSDPLKAKVIEIAKKAADLFGCRDYVRIDFRIDKDGKPYVLEVNPNPDIEEDSGLFAMARKAKMSYNELIGYVVDSAFERKPISE
jgi:D-alanine-D-alanine ligase